MSNATNLIGEAWQLWLREHHTDSWAVNTYGRAAFNGQAARALQAYMSAHHCLPDAAALLALMPMASTKGQDRPSGTDRSSPGK